MKVTITPDDFLKEKNDKRMVTLCLLKSDIELLRALGKGKYARGVRRLLDLLRPTMERTVKEMQQEVS